MKYKTTIWIAGGLLLVAAGFHFSRLVSHFGSAVANAGKSTASPRTALEAKPTAESVVASSVLTRTNDGIFFQGIPLAAAVNGLGKDLGRADIQTLYEFLKDKGTPAKPLKMFSLKNSIMNILRSQTKPPAGLAQVLLEIDRDSSQYAVMRAYALQHLVLWYNQASEEDRKAIQNALAEALKDPSDTVAGTALVSLHRLTLDHPNVDPGLLAQMTSIIAVDSTRGEIARITALQVGSERRLEKLLPTARELAMTSSSIPLRISAIAAVGELGQSSDASLLEQIAKDSVRLQPAVQAAIQRLKERHA